MQKKAQQDESKDNRTVSIFSKLPADLISKSINDFQNTSETVHLSQANHFFNHILAKELKKQKEQRKKEFYEAISMENLFIEGQKINCIYRLIEKYTNKKCAQHDQYSSAEDDDKYTKMILAHAFDLDKKNKKASQLGRYRLNKYDEKVYHYPCLDITSPPECLEVIALELLRTEVEDLAETFNRYYPNINAKWSYNDFSQSGDISFDLNSFLKDVLPVILGLSPKPLLFKQGSINNETKSTTKRN